MAQVYAMTIERLTSSITKLTEEAKKARADVIVSDGYPASLELVC